MAKTPNKIHEVVKWPDPVLAKPGAPVTVFDANLKKLVEEMFESMYAAQGIGLAAPQISISQRLTVIDVSFKKNPEEKLVLINPEIIDRRGSQLDQRLRVDAGVHHNHRHGPDDRRDVTPTLVIGPPVRRRQRSSSRGTRRPRAPRDRTAVSTPAVGYPLRIPWEAGSVMEPLPE